MLRSDFSRKAHVNFQNYFFCVGNVFFQHIDDKSTSISRKIEVHIKSNFHFSVSIDVLTILMQKKHKKNKILKYNLKI